MSYEVILLILGILVLLIGLMGKVKTKEIEVGISNVMPRIIMASVGAVLILLSFYPDITKTFLSAPPKQTGEGTQGTDKELEKEIEQARLAEEQRLEKVKEARLAEERRLKEAKEARLAEEQRRKAEQERLAEEQRLKKAKEERLAEEQHRNVQQARIAIEQRLILPPPEEKTEEATIEGKITFKGDPPPPKIFELSKFPNPEFCGQVDSDGNGNRLLRDVTVNEGRLQDVVVYIKDIEKGKPMNFDRTDVTAENCRFLIQGGASQFVGVVVNKGNIRVTNLDADPDDLNSADGVLHNPHGYEKLGASSTTMFNLPLPTRGGSIEKQVNLRKEEKGSILYLECDQHNYMNAWFYPIENPYYAIVGPEGTFTIDQVPAGNYTILAWHPVLGTQEKEFGVDGPGRMTVNFEFSDKPH